MKIAQRFLLKHKCDDLALSKEYYASDLMLKFAEKEKQKMLKNLRKKTDYDWPECVAAELREFLDKHITK